MEQAEWGTTMFQPLPHSACNHSNRNAMRKCNYRAGMTVLTGGRFDGSGVGIAPKHPTGLCCGPGPKRHTQASHRRPHGRDTGFHRS